jgi:hypothetical protein
MPSVPSPRISDPLPLALVTPEQRNQRIQEWVRATITWSFLVILVLVIVWSCIESRSWNDHWIQTKEMLQMILPAVTGLLGSSLGFYFGKTSTGGGTSSPDATKP